MRDLLNTITPPDEVARAEARRRWNDCAKPLGSLGLLETALEDIAALTGSADIRLDRGGVLCPGDGRRDPRHLRPRRGFGAAVRR